MIGTYFFKDADGTTITVTSERYRQMLDEFFSLSVAELGFEHCWFQQDGANAHTARVYMKSLTPQFPS